jgi:hypothetical protein
VLTVEDDLYRSIRGGVKWIRWTLRWMRDLKTNIRALVRVANTSRLSSRRVQTHSTRRLEKHIITILCTTRIRGFMPTETLDKLGLSIAPHKTSHSGIQGRMSPSAAGEGLVKHTQGIESRSLQTICHQRDLWACQIRLGPRFRDTNHYHLVTLLTQTYRMQTRSQLILHEALQTGLHLRLLFLRRPSKA